MSSFLIEDAYQITGIGVVLVGKVNSGILKPGMKARVDGREIEIKSIEKNHTQLSFLVDTKEGRWSLTKFMRKAHL